MALGFTSHFAKSEHPFGTLLLGSSESETAGSVAYSNDASYASLFNGESYDSCDFSVSVNIDYSQYANFISSSDATETAGSVAYSGCGPAASSVSFSSGGSFSCGSCATTFTC